MADVEHLRAAIGHLRAVPVERDAALADLKSVALTASGMQFTPSVYQGMLDRYLPDFPLLNWGAQVNQSWHVNITSQVRQVQRGEYAAAISGLQRVVAGELAGVDVPGSRTRSVHIDGLDERLSDVTAALIAMTPMVNRLK